MLMLASLLLYIMLVFRQLVSVRPDLKVVLMSATMDSEKLAQYYGGCPVVMMPGRLFPVSEHHLEDIITLLSYSPKSSCRALLRPEKVCQTRFKDLAAQQRWTHWIDRVAQRCGYPTAQVMLQIDDSKINYDLIEELLVHLDQRLGPSEAVLIFLPGMAEIQTVYEQCLANPTLSDPRRFWILPLHSMLSPQVFSCTMIVASKLHLMCTTTCDNILSVSRSSARCSMCQMMEGER